MIDKIILPHESKQKLEENMKIITNNLTKEVIKNS